MMHKKNENTKNKKILKTQPSVPIIQEKML